MIHKVITASILVYLVFVTWTYNDLDDRTHDLADNIKNVATVILKVHHKEFALLTQKVSSKTKGPF